MKRVWQVQQADEATVSGLARDLRLAPWQARLLILRQVSDAQAAERFLAPSLKDLDQPSTMRGVERAVERLVAALSSGERVVIWGDYDVDGVTSTALLLSFLRPLGMNVGYHIPSRLEEGYGLNEAEIEHLADSGARLLLTVDCGISDMLQVRHAVDRGLEVIVIDHHQVPDDLPPALAILNPHQTGCDFGTKELAAVGVVFNLVVALRAELRRRGCFEEGQEPNLRELLDLVALGTVADVVPLLDENRIVTHFGLAELTAGRRPGVAALKEVAGLRGGQVTAGQIAFRLAPRINAVGRLGAAPKAVELLTTHSYANALALARELDQANSQRQAIEQRIFSAALAQAEAIWSRHSQPALVLAADDWHVGVIGIVASRLVEQFGCPVALVALDGEQGRGSARGVEGVHLYQALASCAGHLRAFGGHRMAAGLTVRREELDAFRVDFLRAVAEQRQGAPAVRSVRIDAEASPASWDSAGMDFLSRLAPHGLGNPEPHFLARGVTVQSAKVVGREAPFHLKMSLLDGGRVFGAIGFRMAERLGEVHDRIDLVYSPEWNTYEGLTALQLKLVDFRDP